MGHVLSRSLGMMLLFLDTTVSTPQPVEKPTIAALLEGVPVISNENEDLDQFQFTLETILTPELNYVLQAVWAEPDHFGLCISVGEQRTPAAFLSQDKSMLFDLTSRSALIYDDAKPWFVLRAGDKNMEFTYSVLTSMKAKISVDLPSFLRTAQAHGELTRTRSGDWQLTCFSPSGESKVVATFEDTDGFPIRELEIRSAAEDILKFAFRNIAVNEDADVHWPEFPAAEAIPEGISVLRIADMKLNPGQSLLLQTLAAFAAVQNPQWRNPAIFQDVDWDDAAIANDELGPRLRDLLNVPAPHAGNATIATEELSSSVR